MSPFLLHLLVYDQNSLDLQAMAWGLASYAAAPQIVAASARLATALGKTPAGIRALGEAAGKLPGLGAAPRPVTGLSFSFGFSFGF